MRYVVLLIVLIGLCIGCAPVANSQSRFPTPGGTFASMPANGAGLRIFTVTDCFDSTCAIGGGSAPWVQKNWNGTAWVNSGGGDSNPLDDLITTADCGTPTANEVLITAASGLHRIPSDSLCIEDDTIIIPNLSTFDSAAALSLAIINDSGFDLLVDATANTGGIVNEATSDVIPAGATFSVVQTAASTVHLIGTGTGTGGETNTHSSDGGGLALTATVSKVGADLRLVSLDAGGFSIVADVASIDDDGHAHTGTTLSLIDISDDTNLTRISPILLIGDQLSLQANGVTNVHINETNVFDWSGFSTITNHTIIAGDSGATTTRPAGSNILTSRTHNTDCPGLTDGKQGEVCTNENDGATFTCLPTAGDCDTAAEWVPVDTNAQTICPDPEVLLGDGSCAVRRTLLVAGVGGVDNIPDPRDLDDDGLYTGAPDTIACADACSFVSSTGNTWSHGATGAVWRCETCRQFGLPIFEYYLVGATGAVDCQRWVGGTVNAGNKASFSTGCSSFNAQLNLAGSGGVSAGVGESSFVLERLCFRTATTLSTVRGADISITDDDGTTTIATVNAPDSDAQINIDDVVCSTDTPVLVSAPNLIGMQFRDGSFCASGDLCVGLDVNGFPSIWFTEL